MEAIQWAVGLLVLINLAAVGFLARALWEHIDHCREVQRALGKLEGIPEEIGRMRAHLHNDRNMLLKISGLIENHRDPR
jgi:hypothetical protein